MTAYNGTDYTTSYVYDDDNRVTSVTTNGTTVEYTYDAYGRISQQVTKRGNSTILTETYTYVGTDTTTSGQIATYKTETANYSVTYTYTYDDNGNILSVNDGTYTTTYVYDSANQLVRENNQQRNKTYTWTYDNAGNILSQKAYVYTTGEITESTATAATNSYTYGDENWGDLLTAYNGTAISYDEIGNPDGYSGRTFTWEHGRQLATQTRNGVTWTYTYDANGMRTKRSSDSKTYEYVYSGDKLVQMTITDHTTSPETVQLMEFSYDAAGQPLTMTLDGVLYYYVLNIQGDVMGMVDGNGNLLLSFIYEGFGAGYYTVGTSDMETTLVTTNPLGYRGYVMDTGTGLYYLQSRYYDPALGRFINADGLTSTGQGLLGNNMFAYCLNNPVNLVDYSGQYAIEAILAIILAMVAAVAIVIMADCFARIVVILINELISSSTYKAQKGKESSEKEETEPEPPDVTYPGDDPTKAPDGYEWRGQGEQGSKEGNYYNPETGESWHPDLEHPEPIGPHWDYNYRGSGVEGWRVFDDGTIVLKK